MTLLAAGSLLMEAEQLAPDGGLDGPVVVPSNVLLLERDGRLVLVDAGAGPYAEDWPGGVDRLETALSEVGVRPDAIDTVVLTHLDFDHCGGCAAIPGARVVVPAGALPSGRAGRDVLAQLEAEQRLVSVAAGATVDDGLLLRAAPGHRSGHCIVEVGEGLVHLADVIHHPLHAEQPAADRVFDEDPPTALATRSELLTEMADREVVVTASHIEGPGRIEGTAGALRWRPL